MSFKYVDIKSNISMMRFFYKLCHVSTVTYFDYAHLIKRRIYLPMYQLIINSHRQFIIWRLKITQRKKHVRIQHTARVYVANS